MQPREWIANRRSTELQRPPAYPKIELHVHLEGTVRPEALLLMARRNEVVLPATTVDGLSEVFHFRDFSHFIDVYKIVVTAMQRYVDFVDIVRAYAAEATAQGAVYLELIFSPINLALNGASYDEIFTGFVDGGQAAREEFGIEVRFTPDIGREFSLEDAWLVARHSIRNMDRGVVGLGLGGLEGAFPPELFLEVFAEARAAGLASVPHAGEVAGASSVWGAVESLGAKRIRHGIRSLEDQSLVREIVDRKIVLDVCPMSNLRTGVISRIQDHPLPTLMAAGIKCTVNTDDPALFDTDPGWEHAESIRMRINPKDLYEAGIAGALCDEPTRQRLIDIGRGFDWTALTGAA